MTSPLEGSNPSPSANVATATQTDRRDDASRCVRGSSARRPSARAAGSRWRRGSRPRGPARAISAPAFPVTCAAGDNLAIHVAVAEAPAGAVIVVSVGVEPERGYWGEVLTTGAEARGIAGLVIDGGVRDVDRARGARLPRVLVDDRVAGRDQGACPAGSAGRRSSATCWCTQGDWIVADADGVTVVPIKANSTTCSPPAGRARSQGSRSSSRRSATAGRRSSCSGSTPSPDRPRLSSTLRDAAQAVDVGVRDRSPPIAWSYVVHSSYDHDVGAFDRHACTCTSSCAPSRRGTCSRGSRRPRRRTVASRSNDVSPASAVPPAMSVEPRGTMKQRITSPVVAVPQPVADLGVEGVLLVRRATRPCGSRGRRGAASRCRPARRPSSRPSRGTSSRRSRPRRCAHETSSPSSPSHSPIRPASGPHSA